MNEFNNLLRPIVEVRGVIVSVLLIFVTYFLKEAMLFLPELGIAMCVFFLFSAIYYSVKAFRLYVYHRSLSSSAPYTMASYKIYKSDSVYFMGKGFEWTAEHTKRIKDLYDRKNTVFLYASKFEKKFKAWLLIHKRRLVVGHLFLFFSSYYILNPFPPRNQTGAAAIHAIGTWEGEESILMNIDATNHILIVGGTGAGKSCGFQVLATQDIESGRPTIGIDPKGGFKVFSAMYDAAVRNGKVDQFKIIHLAFPELSSQYNAIGSYHRITEISGRITEGIDSEENFKQFAWLKSNFIAVGLHYLGEQATFDKIKYYMTRCDELVKRYCELYIKRNCANAEIATDTLNTHLKRAMDGPNRSGHDSKSLKTVAAVNELIVNGHMSDSSELQTIISYMHENVMHERKLIRNIEPILEKLTTGSIAQILVPDYDDLDSDRAILDWGQLLNDGEILYVGTNALGDPTISSTFLQILLEDLMNYLGSVYQYGKDYGRLSPASDDKGFLPKTVALHIDELSAIKTTAVKNLLARAGEVGVKLRIYTQSHADLVNTLGSRENAEAAIDNFGAILMFRVNNWNTANILVSRLNEVTIEKEGKLYGFSDSASPETPEDFGSSSMQREEADTRSLLAHQSLMSLPTGEAFLLTNGTRLEKIRMPLIKVDEGVAPDSIRQMIKVMKKNDLNAASSERYEDTWFKAVYPEFTNDGLNESGVEQEVATAKLDKDGYFPAGTMTGPMQAEVEADAAEFSIHSGES